MVEGAAVMGWDSITEAVCVYQHLFHNEFKSCHKGLRWLTVSILCCGLTYKATIH